MAEAALWADTSPVEIARRKDKETNNGSLHGGVLSTPAAFSQKEQPQRLFTYVSQFQVPRANWAQFAEETEKLGDPVLERLMADDTIVSWGDFESVVHTPDGMTHGSWWQATSFKGILRVLDELRKAGPRPAREAATKHEDALLHTNVIFATPHGVTTGYLHVFATHCQPGKGDDYVALLKKYSRRQWKKR